MQLRSVTCPFWLSHGVQSSVCSLGPCNTMKQYVKAVESRAKRWLSFPLGTGNPSNCHHHSSSLFKGSKEWVTIWQGLVGWKEPSEVLFSFVEVCFFYWNSQCVLLSSNPHESHSVEKLPLKTVLKERSLILHTESSSGPLRTKQKIPHEPSFRVGVNGLTCHDDPPPELSLWHIFGFRRRCSYNTRHCYYSQNLHNPMVYICSHMLLSSWYISGQYLLAFPPHDLLARFSSVLKWPILSPSLLEVAIR